ncbi:MAG TPA: efflux RND transporter permease subunit, partial [Bacteroidales bacterium]|nr:efflux RND transporter permease subunit [Bacteroidales bacterium]
MKKNNFKEFFATSWAIDSKTSVYVLAIFITMLGIQSYLSIPKEQFPEIVIPTVLVNTVYPGTSPTDMENLITRPIEKQLKGVAGVKKITSSSLQDYSMVAVEFNTDVEIPEAKQRVKDAVDKARTDLPNNLPRDPDVAEIDFSEIPIMYVQLSGNYDLEKLKKYAETAQDRIESFKEITRVDIVGALEREIQIDVDIYKMQAASATFSDIERAVAAENVTVSAGNITTYGMKRSIRVVGQFSDVSTLRNLAFKSSSGALVYLKDVATITDGFKEQESYSRLNGENVITLNVIKKSGQNLIEASDKIKELINNELKTKVYPSDLKVSITGDMSRYTRNTLDELNNTIILGFILVTIVLMFFMGFTNSFFVGLSVPLSMFVAYMVMPGLGFTMNMIVMFGFIFALGIVVDDAIVVIENTHRIHRTEPNIVQAAKKAAGEVFLPILSGTLTTLAPFFPLAFWPGIVGKFMYYIPVTLILTLFASLFVAYIINPVFAVSFMKHEYDEPNKERLRKRIIKTILTLLGISLIGYLVYAINKSEMAFGFGNLMVFAALMVVFYHVILKPYINWWQTKGWPWFMKIYENQLRFFLKGRNPYWLLAATTMLFFLTFVLLGIEKPKVLFFPDNQPNSIDVFIKMPIGTDQKVTDSVTKIVEQRVYSVLGKDNPNVESVISNVALGAGEGIFDRSTSSEKGKVTINFVEYKNRTKKVNTSKYLDDIRLAVKGIPGAEINVSKNRMGPPTGKPINIEVSGENLEDLIADAENFQHFLDSIQIPGVEELKSDFKSSKPEIQINIDRTRANIEGISTGQIALEIRTSVLGKEISKYKEGEDEFPIQLRYSKETRENINNLMNLKITYRDMNTGILRQIPLSSVAKIDYTDTYGGINRQNLKRVISISSEVLSGYTANEIVPQIEKYAASFPKHDGIEIKLTGEQEDQAEAAGFLGKAMLIAIGLIFFILISQFNSLSKSLLILSEVFFSIIGVLLGIVIFNMNISIIMTGLGVVALGGIVVRNGILIVEFIDTLKARGYKTREAIVQAGKIRITPVILTATATILGLVPLAVGFNMNFVTLFTHLNPHIHIGGDNVMFFGSLAWTIIFGLSFATFLTLIFVPAMYLITYELKIRLDRRKS